MKNTYRMSGKTQLVALSGRLDSSTSAAFRKEIAARIVDDGPCLVFDCSALAYMDSSGLGVFVSCLRKVLGEGGDIRLAALTPRVGMLLELTRVDKVFQIFATVEEALASFLEHPADAASTIHT